MITLLIVLVVVVVFEVMAHPGNPAAGVPEVPLATLQKQPSLTVEQRSPSPTKTVPPTPLASSASPEPSAQVIPFPTSIPTNDPTQFSPLAPTRDPNEDWMSFPIIPAITDTTRQIYQKGLALGNNPNAFSKVGDCNTLSPRFLTYFDETPASNFYNLEAFSDLKQVISHFSGSFKRESLAVGDGFNTSAILSPFRADLNFCEVSESPLECEYRLHKPSFALIVIGTDDYLKPADFEDNVRQIVEITINDGVVPILATKADDANQLNYNPIIAKVAEEYDVPLWNLWLAQQPLPEHGLLDNVHPTGTFAAFDFSASNLGTYGWPVRNLTALQVLEAVWQGVIH
jgi:hypothetical protein